MFSLVLICLIGLLETSSGRTITFKGDNGIILEGLEKDTRFAFGPTIRKFATHKLCESSEGKINFYNALNDHLRDVSDDLITSLVMDLCKNKDVMLNQWVEEIYDSDRDGHISHHESTYYDKWRVYFQ